MNAFSRLLATVTLGVLALPAVVFADVPVRSCCAVLRDTAVSQCYQFIDVLPGNPSEAEQVTMRDYQQYSCGNVPQQFSDHQGKTSRLIRNDADNSGVCGTALSIACPTRQGNYVVGSQQVYARCQTASDCLSATNYLCQNNFCKLKEGQPCAGDNGLPINCADGLLCRTTFEGSKCLTPEADVSAPAGAAAGGSVSQEPAPFVPVVPELGVPIPGFEFTPATEENGIVSVPYLSQYINAIYRYMTAIVLTVAIVMVMIGGFKYLLSATPLGVSDGKKMITDSLIGMTLVLGAYVILNTVNPSLTSLNTLTFERINAAEYFVAEDGLTYAADGEPVVMPGGFATAAGSAGQFIVVDDSRFERLSTDCVHLNTPVDPDLIEPLRRAGEIFCRTRTDQTMKILGGGYRAPSLSARLWIQRCIKKTTCTVPIGPPFERGVYGRDGQGRFTFTNPSLKRLVDSLPDQSAQYSESQIAALYSAALPYAGTRGDNAHGRGLALDLGCGSGGAINQSVIRSTSCQVLLEQAMKQAGFCRIPNEWWHFELAAKSSTGSCNPNWSIGSVTVTRNDGSTVTGNYASCTGEYGFNRLKSSGNGCSVR